PPHEDRARLPGDDPELPGRARARPPALVLRVSRHRSPVIRAVRRQIIGSPWRETLGAGGVAADGVGRGPYRKVRRMADEEPVLVREQRGSVLVLRLNRPDARNALNGALMGALGEGIHE